MNRDNNHEIPDPDHQEFTLRLEHCRVCNSVIHPAQTGLCLVCRNIQMLLAVNPRWRALYAAVERGERTDLLMAGGPRTYRELQTDKRGPQLAYLANDWRIWFGDVMLAAFYRVLDRLEGMDQGMDPEAGR